MKRLQQSLIEKTLNNEATQEEAREVIRWFSTSEGQEWLSSRMDLDERIIALGEEDKFIDHPVPSVSMYSHIISKIRKQKIRRLILNSAAIIIPIILFIGLFIELNNRVDLFSKQEYAEVRVPKGEQMQIIFQDGSRAFLNSGSYMRYPRKFGLFERKVELEGEGWFDVAQQKNRPFIVDMKTLKIQVLGTTFDAKAYPDDNNISIGLETGSIELTGKTFKAVKVQPGEKVVYDRISGKYQVVVPDDIESLSAWKQNTFVFTDAPLAEVIKTLSRSFDVTFNIENQASLKYHYTLRTTSKDLSLILDELQKLTPVRFIINGDVIQVSAEK